MRGEGLGAWSWAFVAFRVADGATSSLLPLAALLRYDLSVAGVAGVVALLNLGAVPAVMVWCRVMDRSRARRRLSLAGMAASALCFAVLSLPLPLWGYLAAAVGAVVFGVAIAPASGVLLLEGRPRRMWAAATGRLSRRTSVAYLAGLAGPLVMGLLDVLDPQAVFLGAAAVGLLAAVLAAWTIPPRRSDAATAAADAAASALDRMPAAAQRLPGRRFEGAVFRPGRLRHGLSLGSLASAGRSARLLAGVATMFAGSMVFFSGYQGALVHVVGLSAGMVLLAESGSHVANTAAYTWAGNLGHRKGEARAISLGVAMRWVGMATLAAAVLWGGDHALAGILVGAVVAGVSFALLQVNTPCLLAGLHPSGGSAGVGAYHTAVAAGVLVGAGLGFLLASWLSLGAAYAASLALVGAGGALLLTALPRGTSPGHASDA